MSAWPRARRSTSRAADAVVVDGGVIGCAVAWALAGRAKDREFLRLFAVWLRDAAERED